MTFQEKAIVAFFIGAFLAVIFYDLGENNEMNKIETIKASERLRILCHEQPSNAVCAIIKRVK